MIRFTKSDVVDVDRYAGRLRYDGFICFERGKVEQILPYYKSHAATCCGLAKDLMIYKSGGSCCLLSRESVAEYLIRYEFCPQQYFKSSKTEGYSIDMKRVLSKLQANGFAKEFFDYYFEYRTWENKCSKLQKLVDNCTERAGRNKHGGNLYKIPFEVNRQKNLRFNYKNYDLIGQIPKKVSSCISVPDGYFLAWGDFAQSDFRIAYNLFLRSPENDKLMNLYDDKYEALARIVAKTEGVAFDLEKFQQERNLYKTLTLATMYGTRDSLVPAERRFIQTFTGFLEKCPKYRAYCKRLMKRIELSLPIILTSYFGDQEAININTSYKTHVLDDALNSPVQKGTSEIIILAANSILDLFYSMGFSEDDIRLYYVRHDEPIFRIKETMIPHLWVFEQYRKILVDGWTPLQLDFEFGYNYKMPDDALAAAARASAEENQGRITELEAGTWIDTEYYPVADVFNVTVHWIKTGNGKTVVAFYSPDLNQAMYSLFDTSDDAAVANEVKCRMRDAEKKIYGAGYRGIVVQSNFLDGEDYFGNTFINYQQCTGSVVTNVSKLCRLMVYRYCRKSGIECPVEKPVFSTFDKWFQTLSDLELMIV